MVIPDIDKTAGKYNLIGYKEKDSLKINRNTFNYEGECTNSSKNR
jgi:hypothetical protein